MERGSMVVCFAILATSRNDNVRAGASLVLMRQLALVSARQCRIALPYTFAGRRAIAWCED